MLKSIMNKQKASQLILLSKAMLIIIALLFSFTACVQSSGLVSEKEVVKLIRVVDGDTAYFITPSFGEVSVRFSGINTPEINPKTGQPEYYGVEAKNFTNKILKEAKLIEIQWDLTQDKSGDRELGIIFTDGVNLNILLVQEGYADLRYLKDHMPYAKEYKVAQKKAQAMKIGIWK